MNLLSKTTRRAFVAAQAALAGLAALPRATMAGPQVPTKATAAGCAPADTCLPARWNNATAEELHRFVGDRFRVKTRDHGTVAMKLTAIEPAKSGSQRPAGLSRREGVIAVFETPDIEPLLAAGHTTHRVHHPQIGSADLFLGPVPKRYGGHTIELVLN